MKLPRNVPVFGDPDFRGQCPTEVSEQIAFFTAIRKAYPTTYGAIAVHVPNEGLRSYAQARWRKAEGMTKGAADIVIPGSPGGFVCELKRRDHTKSKIDDDQVAYLLACKAAGAFVCIALGHGAALDAFHAWINQ